MQIKGDPKLLKNEIGAYTVFHKRRFGSNYPNLTKEERKKYKHLINTRKSINKFIKKIEHPNLYYKALDMINRNSL